MRISDWSSDVCSSDLQHAGDAPVGGFGAVADDDDAAVLGVAHPYPAAMVQADPGGAAGDVEHGVEQGPVADGIGAVAHGFGFAVRSEEHTSELQSLMRISYAVFCLKKKNKILRIQKTKYDQL